MSNLAATGLRRRRRNGRPMADYDRLPADLRAWVAAAVLPWSPRSVARAFARALARHRGDRTAALAELDRLQQHRLAGASPMPQSNPLTVRKRRGRKRATGTQAPILAVPAPNARWSVDFVHDQLSGGRRLRILNVVDDATKECLAAAVDTSILGRHVARELAVLVARGGGRS